MDINHGERTGNSEGNRRRGGVRPGQGRKRILNRWPSLACGIAARGETDATLAAKIGVSEATVRYWRLGKKHPMPEHLRAAEMALGLPAGALGADAPRAVKNLSVS